MFPVLIWALLTTAPIHLAAPGLKPLDVSAATAELISDRLAQALEARGMRVITPQQLSALIGAERQKALLGCGEESSECMAELAGALAVDGIVSGSLGRVGTRLVLNVSILAIDSGAALARYSGTTGREVELLDEIDRAAAALSTDLTRRLRPVAPRPGRTAAWWTGGVGLVCLGAGAVFSALAKRQNDLLDPPGGLSTLDFESAVAAREIGKSYQTTSLVSLGVGTILGGISAYLLVRASSDAVAVGFSPDVKGLWVAGPF